jgi:hypothetical protein
MDTGEAQAVAMNFKQTRAGENRAHKKQKDTYHD